MKKIICMVLTVSVFSSGLFAKTWSNNVGVGASFPYSVYDIDDNNADNVAQRSYGLEGFYLGVHENGFTVKGVFDCGLATSKDIKVQDFDKNLGMYFNGSVGAGYSFINTEKTLFGFTAMVGYNADVYIDVDNKDVAGVKHELTTTLAMVTANIGADLFVRQKISDCFGFYVNTSVRYVIGGVAVTETKDEYKEAGADCKVEDDEKNLIFGNYTIKPSIGFTWTF